MMSVNLVKLRYDFLVDYSLELIIDRLYVLSLYLTRIYHLLNLHIDTSYRYLQTINGFIHTLYRLTQTSCDSLYIYKSAAFISALAKSILFEQLVKLSDISSVFDLLYSTLLLPFIH